VHLQVPTLRTQDKVGLERIEVPVLTPYHPPRRAIAPLQEPSQVYVPLGKPPEVSAFPAQAEGVEAFVLAFVEFYPECGAFLFAIAIHPSQTVCIVRGPSLQRFVFTVRLA